MNQASASILGDLPRASISRRLLAEIIDNVIALAAGFAAMFVGRMLDQDEIYGVAAYLLYLLLADGLPGGQSIGKRVMGIAVLHARSGQPCSVACSVLRNVTMLILGIIDVVFVLGERRRRLGDMLAGTTVVKVAAATAPALPSVRTG